MGATEIHAGGPLEEYKRAHIVPLLYAEVFLWVLALAWTGGMARCTRITVAHRAVGDEQDGGLRELPFGM